LLGVMELEAGSYAFKDLPKLILVWLQDAGGFAAFALFLWFLYALFTPNVAVVGGRRQLISRFMVVMGLAALVLYVVSLGLMIGVAINDLDGGYNRPPAQGSDQVQQAPEQTGLERAFEYTLALAGLFALLGFCEPFVLDLSRLRWRRIYALAKLSFKEAIR